MKILEELWYGNITPNARDVERGSRQQKIDSLLIQNEQELIPLLSEKAKEVYEKARENQTELNDLNECEAFCIGFRLGARIAYEVMDGMDIPSIDD